MEDKIFDIVTNLLRHDISKQEAIDKLLILHNVSNMLPDEIDGFLNYIRETCITDCNDWHNLLHNKQFDSNHELYRQYLKDKK